MDNREINTGQITDMTCWGEQHVARCLQRDLRVTIPQLRHRPGRGAPPLRCPESVSLG